MHEASFWRERLLPYIGKSDAIGMRQVLLTILPFVALWVGYASLAGVARWLLLPIAMVFALLLTLFILRSFVLMHDCGHGSLFKTRSLNQFFGFVFGVITGMPQFVWSKNHTYHHNTNGDWVKYGGVFNILSTEKFEILTEKQKRRYWLFRQPAILIPAGFFYVLFNPRFNWLLGNLKMIIKIARPLLAGRWTQAKEVARKWETKHWKGHKDYWHMTYNNVALLSIWVGMSAAMGAGHFFLLYVISTSLAGSVGILLFTIQHNFEGSYATDTERVCHYRAALEGTSMLVLPAWLNWFTADIAYHHVHHLSVAIPNYRLAACHRDFADLFSGVKRVHARDLLGTFQFQLWDANKQKVVARDYSRSKEDRYGARDFFQQEVIIKSAHLHK